MVKTWKHERGQDTRENRETVRHDAGGIFGLNATRRSAMHRSKLDVGGADAGAGGKSIRSGRVGADASSSSDSSAMAHSTGPSGAGSGSICFANK